MFRKGIVTFFDEGLSRGLITLNTDHQQIVFKIEDFSNGTLLPQIGERVKCVVLEQHGELLAKFIVRLDYKNFSGDQKKEIGPTHSYENSSQESIQTTRKLIKKRRLNVETEPCKDQTINKSQAIYIKKDKLKNYVYIDQAVNHVQSIKRDQVVEPIITQNEVSVQQDDISNDVKSLANDHIIQADESVPEYVINQLEKQPKFDSDVEVIEFTCVQEIAQSENIQATRNAQNDVFENVRLNVIQEASSQETTHNGMEQITAQSIQTQSVQGTIDHLAVSEIDNPIRETQRRKVQNDTVLENRTDDVNNKHANVESEKIKQEKIKQEKIVALNEQHEAVSTNREKIQLKSDLVTEATKNEYLSSIVDQELLEKNMNLTRLQKYIHSVKVKFFYSKRKQALNFVEDKSSFHLNRWVVLVGCILLLSISGVMYAVERVKQYKNANELKLHQYEMQQKEVIKKQKQEAHAR